MSKYKKGSACSNILCCHYVALATYKHGNPVDVFESASERRGADGIDARA
jgi:hypothetical protein